MTTIFALIATALLSVIPVAHKAPTAKPLSGYVVGIDPGHNGDNYKYPSYLNHQVWNGREYEDCDTTGTETNGGYTEPRFTWRVASYLRQDLVALGATVVLTRHNNHGKGPCVDKRAKILNRGHAKVSIDIHGDGGPSSGRGFAILEPVKDKENRHVIKSSERFGSDLRRAMLNHTSMPVSTYDGTNGVTHRDDLAGLNLTTEPKVLIECGNMRNSTDAGLMTKASFQRRLARAMSYAIRRFLVGG
jgi:N-acetylmuramoyl-L-alanine amidase